MKFLHVVKLCPYYLLAAAALFFGIQDALAQGFGVRLEPAFPEVQFEQPLGFRYADDGSNLVYVAEFSGIVKVLENDHTVTEATVFLDLSERLATQPAGEFYTIEFHPDYAENGHFFVRYKLQNPHRTVLSRFTRSAEDSLRADPESEQILFEIETPDNVMNHHGGDLAFGPDGFLYVAMGDGGSPLDAVGNAQNRSSLLGKILRLDVDQPADGMPYGLPPDNPFVGNDQGWRNEIFAYGLRNPWRMTIDRETGDLWVADVGEVTWEEINRVEAGKNYGWPIMEGPECLGGGDECDQTGLEPPLFAYGRDVGICVTGGYVYRGSAIPALVGKYVFADFTSGNFWTLDASNPEHAPDPLFHAWVNTSSFGEDPSGELYLTHLFDGVLKLVPDSVSTGHEPDLLPPAARLDAPYPNPAGEEVKIGFHAERSTHARLTLYDILGREVAELFDGYVAFADRREITFSTRGLTAGVYFCRLELGDAVQIRKVIIAQ